MGDNKETAADGKKSGNLGGMVTKVIAAVFGAVIAPILVAVGVRHFAPAEKPPANAAAPDKPSAGSTSAQADSADDFQVGAKLTGTKVNSWMEANGKPVVVGADLEVEVTRRSGKEFTAEFWVRSRKGGDLYEGTIEQGRIQAKLTKSLTGDANRLVGNAVFTGRFEKGILTGTIRESKGNPTYRGEIEVKLRKE